MSVRVLPDFLVNQIAAGEVVERPASVVKELVENALDAGADQILIDVVDGGRTRISVIDNGSGMSKEDLLNSILRHATSKLPENDLSNISFMGFRGEALPSIASVSHMFIDTHNGKTRNGWQLNADTGEIKPSDWESGTRIQVKNLFSKTPARLKFLHSDHAELLAVLETVKRLAVARPDVGFVLNNKWFFQKDSELKERAICIMGEDARDNLITINKRSSSSDMHLYGFISKPTLRRASSIDQYLFVNGRPVKDKILVSALRAAYMDVMHAREFPLCALYLDLPTSNVDVNVSPAKTEVHFLEPNHVRSFIIKSLREALSETLVEDTANQILKNVNNFGSSKKPSVNDFVINFDSQEEPEETTDDSEEFDFSNFETTILKALNPDEFVADLPLGRVIGQLNNKYILAENKDGFVIVDQHAAHERITYEKLRTKTIKKQPLLSPIIITLRKEDVIAVLSIAEEINESGLQLEQFGDNAIAIFEKPADWDLDWEKCLHEIAEEVRSNGHSVKIKEKLHLKLANYACHHSVRAGQKLNYEQMDALLRDIERTEHGSECNHGRPVYKIIPISDLDVMFERK